jgi:predicted AlkP superfamily pyrophosphatase or phosphodiesterase
MPNLTSSILQQIKKKNHDDFLSDGDFIFPQYQGLSILNIPPSLGELFNFSGFSAPTLAPEIMGSIGGKTQNIILILLDALAFHRFNRWLEEDPGLVWRPYLDQGTLVPLTSITPSTTCAALTTYWTGASAAAHGIMGYEMWLKEYGLTANMIEHKPITYQARGGNLTLAGFAPESFLPVESVANNYLDHGVEVHAFQHYSIIHSGLSRMFMADAERHPIGTAQDMWISIRELMESQPSVRKYIWAYWDHLDSISHLHGPDSERAKAEMVAFSKAFEDYFLKELDPNYLKDTLIILTADHGQITTDRDDGIYDLKNHPEFTNMLHMLPTGENRLAYLYIKPGKTEAVKDYIQSTWPDEFTLVDPEIVVDKGLFGPGEPHPDIYDRIGDLIAVARGKAYWWWAAKENPLIGRHGGMSQEEMLVPFLAIRM